MKSKERLSNIELLRIFAMLAIVASHYVTFGIINSTYTDCSWREASLFLRIITFLLSSILGGGNTSVAIFFIITGFFKVSSDKVKVSKVICEVFFYSVFSIFVFLVFAHIFGIEGSKKLLFGRILASFFVPVSSNLWWFVTAYVIVILLSPAVNAFLRRLSQKQFLACLFVAWLLLYCIANLLTHLGSFCPYYDLQRGVFFYSIGAYLSVYKKTQDDSRVGVSRQILRIVLIIILSMLYGLQRWLQYDGLELISIPHKIAFDYLLRFIGQCVFVPCIALNLFLFFLDLPIKANNCINRIASATFGVYLLHNSPLLTPYIWNDMLHVLEKQYFSDFYIVKALATILLIFAICTLVDFLRQMITIPLMKKIRARL